MFQEVETTSKYLERNESIGVVQELMIKAAMSRHNKQDLINEVENCGIPVVGQILRIAREETDKILWERMYDLVDYCVVMLVWKCIMGSGFRPIFAKIMYRLLTEVDPQVLRPHIRDPKVWNVNRRARVLKRCRHK